MARQITIGLVVIFIASSCEIPLGSRGSELEINEGDYSIITSGTQHNASIVGEKQRWVQIDIPSVFTNNQNVPVFFTGCRPPNTPLIQRKTGRDWDIVFWPVYNLCLSPAVSVLPGESIALPSSMVACFLSQKCGPEFRGPVNGVYRLIQNIYYDPEGKELIPVEHRVSNAFELVAVPG